MPAILFVCLGNICRSPLAEGALRHAVTTAGLDWRIDSAGTGGWHQGESPDPRAQAVAARHGVNISRLRARQIVAPDIDRFDRILAMDDQNLLDLKRFFPNSQHHRITLALDVVRGRQGESVADPYYWGDAEFERTWLEVQAIARALVGTS